MSYAKDGDKIALGCDLAVGEDVTVYLAFGPIPINIKCPHCGDVIDARKTGLCACGRIAGSPLKQPHA